MTLPILGTAKGVTEEQAKVFTTTLLNHSIVLFTVHIRQLISSGTVYSL
jgi:hypothetical protein